MGTRTDEIGGRKTRTVFYEKDGKRIAYTIVDGDPLSTPGERRPRTARGPICSGSRRRGGRS